ncbi:MAG: S41 family peptidase [Flavobacteriales bacterium]|nr:S41 family peptidase [Flavobacteriales bacterium]
MWRRAIGLLTCALPLWASLAAQYGPLERVVYPDDLRDDLAIMRQTLEQAHPDPYRYRVKTELDMLFDAIAASMDTPMTAEGFIRAGLPVLKAIGDAGTNLEPPLGVQDLYAHTVPLIPITVRVIGGRVYLDEELKGFRSLPTACEVVRINGRPATEILALLRGAQVPEGADTTLLDRRIERNFPAMYHRHVEAGNKFEVDYRTTDGTRGTQDVFAMTMDEMRQVYKPKGIDLQAWRMEELPDIRCAWLTLSSFEEADLAAQRINPERFLNSVMGALRKSGATSLVIDVRGAHGQDPGMAEQVFGLIAQRTYRVLQSMSIRSGRVPDSYRYAVPAPEFFASVDGMYMPEANGRRVLKAEDPRLKPLKPLEKAFAGKVYVLCDGMTTGAAAAFVMLAKRTGRARTVGEETGSNASSFCGGRTIEVTLPHTGCVLRVPLTRFVPEGSPEGAANRGEMPSYAVPQRAVDLAHGKDSVRDALLRLIEEMQ